MSGVKEIQRDAVLSDEHPPRFRYLLTRRWAPGKRALFVMLNPSTADARRDDPTIRACIAFARRWGYGQLDVANLYALRSSKPAALKSEHAAGRDVIGPDNDDWIRTVAATADLIVAAWGANEGPDVLRAFAVRELVGDRWHVLGFTKGGYPRHPSPRAWTGEDVSTVRPVPWPLDSSGPRAVAPDVNDLCECGHSRGGHRGGVCIAWVPALPLKSVDYRRHAIEVVTQTLVASSSQGRAHDYGSSVCACRELRPSGYRVVIPDDVEQARRVREGRTRRTVLPIAEL